MIKMLLPILLVFLLPVTIACANPSAGNPHIRVLLVAGDGAGRCVPSAYALYIRIPTGGGTATHQERVAIGREMRRLVSVCSADARGFLAYCQDSPTCFYLPPAFRGWDVAQRFLRAGHLAATDTVALFKPWLTGKQATRLEVEYWVSDLERWHQARTELISQFPV